MDLRLTPAHRQLLQELARVDDLIGEGKHGQARDILLAAREAVREAGWAHGTISRRLAVVCDWMHDLEDAMKFILEALAQDPLAPPFRQSFEVIAGRMRKALADEKRSPLDPSTPRLYRLLVQHDQADQNAHLAMARWHLQRGEPEQAYRLLDALTVLSPTSGAAWTARAEVARQLGREDEAAESDLEALACRKEQTPLFAIPGEATA